MAPATTLGAAPLVDAGWLASLLVTDDGSGPLSAGADDQLRRTPFEAIIAAIERGRPGSTGAAEILLYRRWIAANTGVSPHLFAAWFNLGAALGLSGDKGAALAAYGSARALRPDFYPAAVNLGLGLEAAGQVDLALAAWDGAIQTNEARTSLLNHRARLLEKNGRLDEAEAVMRTSLLTDPAQPDVVQHWVHIRQKACRWPVLQADMPGLPAEALLQQAGPLGLLALTDDVDVQRDVIAGWIARKIPAIDGRLEPPRAYRHDRIRIGYLSSDFCRHAMSFLVAELFEHHDRSRFEIYGYCSTLEDGSEIRQRVLAGFDHQRIIRGLSDEQAARMIRDDEIDILVDLNGLTAHTRLAVLKWRPAPIQATYLGFIGPLPMPEIDYLFCDDFVIPPERADAYRPTPVAIAPIYQANDSKREIAAPLTRVEAGLPEDAFVLCCFSNSYKITEAMFAAWMAIMASADRSVLWLAVDNRWAQENLLAHAECCGIAPARILFAGRTSPELYMSRLGAADLFLDTFPYNAGTVASDAIRMQLPLLTLSGASFASRMAGSMLHAIDAHQGITKSFADYVETGTMLATRPEAYAAYRQHFTREAWHRTAGNIDRFTGAFELRLTELVSAQHSAS
nr:glycosyl transferase family 1 [uncultured Lichenicoccus sp.]